MSRDNAEEGWRGFIELCSKIESPEEFDSLFALFLTFEEREILASRYWIVRALLEVKLTQREIAEKYRVSIAQITRGSNALKSAESKLKAWLKNKLNL